MNDGMKLPDYSEVDLAVWKTIPEMATLLRIDVPEMAALMNHFGLRWKGRSHRWHSYHPTTLAEENGFCLKVYSQRYNPVDRWHFSKIRELMGLDDYR